MTAGPFAKPRCSDVGRVLRYSPGRQEDCYDDLGEASLYDSGDEWSGFEVTEAEFERAWNSNEE